MASIFFVVALAMAGSRRCGRAGAAGSGLATGATGVLTPGPLAAESAGAFFPAGAGLLSFFPKRPNRATLYLSVKKNRIPSDRL
jgi:hypothetical protein